ncbi:MAG: beta-1,6-N-acetylglucosaminyltransferase, partial [Actinomycetota bacterium]|nr:beta-1,6-N-acetylglucosaminyltransferase [Actinomycetota bacterium]
TRSLLDSAAPDCVALISGTHYPLGHDRLRRLLASAPGCQFMDALPMPRAGYPGGGGLDRVRTLHPFEGTKWFALRASGLARRVQRLTRYERRLPSDAVPHVGSQWWVLTATCLADMLESPSLPAYERFFRRSWIPDESFFQTWVANSPYAASVRPDPVVFARWEGGSGPAVLTLDDLSALRLSAAPFARKVEPEASRSLMDVLDDDQEWV